MRWPFLQNQLDIMICFELENLSSYKDSNILVRKEILFPLLILPWLYFLLVLLKAAHRWSHG